MKDTSRKFEEGFFSLRSIKRKLGWSFGILILFIAIMAFFAYYTNVSVWDDSQAVRTINTPLNLMVEQVIAYDAMLTGDMHWALLDATNNESEELIERKKSYDEVGAKLDQLLKVDARNLINKSRRSQEDKQKVYGILSKLDEINLKLVDLELKAFEAIDKGDLDSAFSLVCEGKYYGYKDELAGLYKQWATEEARVAEYYRQRALNNNVRVRYINLSLAIILILASLIIPFLISKTVVRPMRKLTDIADDISSGDLNVKIPYNLKKNKSEVGELANAFDKLLESSHFALKTLVESKMDKKYGTMYASSGDAIMTLEPPNWNFTSGNVATVKMFNTKNEKEFISLKPSDLSPKYQPDGQLSSIKSKRMIEKAMKDGTNFFEWAHKRYNGKEFLATVLLSKIKEGGKSYLQATVRDQTKEKLMLGRENKIKGKK